MIRLEAITWDNLRDVMNIKIPDAQKPFVRSIPTFLAQSYVNLKEGYEDASLAIYEGEALIGYVKLVFVPAGEAVYAMPHDSLMIDALIIDGAFQGKGYGHAAMDAITTHVRKRMNHANTALSLVILDDNVRALRLAQSHGFSFLKKRGRKRPMSVYIKTDV